MSRQRQPAGYVLDYTSTADGTCYRLLYFRGAYLEIQQQARPYDGRPRDSWAAICGAAKCSDLWPSIFDRWETLCNG